MKFKIKEVVFWGIYMLMFCFIYICCEVYILHIKTFPFPFPFPIPSCHFWFMGSWLFIHGQDLWFNGVVKCPESVAQSGHPLVVCH